MERRKRQRTEHWLELTHIRFHSRVNLHVSAAPAVSLAPSLRAVNLENYVNYYLSLSPSPVANMGTLWDSSSTVGSFRCQSLGAIAAAAAVAAASNLHSNGLFGGALCPLPFCLWYWNSWSQKWLTCMFSSHELFSTSTALGQPQISLTHSLSLSLSVSPSSSSSSSPFRALITCIISLSGQRQLVCSVSTTFSHLQAPTANEAEDGEVENEKKTLEL